MSITIKVTLSPEIQYDGHKADSNARARLFFRVFIALFRLVMIVVGYHWAKIQDTCLFGIALILFGAYPFVQPYLIRRRLKKQFAQTPELGEPVTWTFTEDGVSNSGPLGTNQAAWKGFVGIVKQRSGILLYPGPATFVWLPAHEFQTPSDMDEVLNMAKAGGIPTIRAI